MPPVLITCPKSQRSVPTGLTADAWEELDDFKPEYVLEPCPDCGGSHTWTPQDAVVVPSRSP